jgi:hypothetical protein
MSNLQQWWIRIRHTAWFRWSHAPLCKRFEHDVWAVGHWHICRSCVLLYASGLVALVGSLAAGLDASALTHLAVAVLVPATLLSYPMVYKKVSRGWRDPIRAGMGAGLGLWLALAVSGGHWIALALLFPLLAIYLFYRAQRRTLKRHMCDGCSEWDAEETAGICSGYARQAESIRFYQVQIENSLNDGTAPPCTIGLPISKAV